MGYKNGEGPKNWIKVTHRNGCGCWTVVVRFYREDLKTGRDWAMQKSEGSELHSLMADGKEWRQTPILAWGS